MTEGLASGALVTVLLTVGTSFGSILAAFGLAAARFSGGAFSRRLANAYVEVFRNVPALIQIIFLAFALPTVFPDDLRRTVFFDNWLADIASRATGLPLPYYALAAGVGLVLNTSAHLAEILKAGIAAVPTAHIDAVRTMGATQREAFRSVALPDGLRAVFPGVSNRLVHNMKNTALASFVAVPELFHQMQAAINRTFQASELLLLTSALYLALSIALTGLLAWVDQRLHRGQR